MRLRSLDLIRFGHFADRRLDFSDGAFGLHVVYGPNEAGKSTALRALENLLYGFPARTDDDFLYKYAELRIGAVLEDDAGEPFACVRRKGRQKTLRDGDDDGPADEARLSRMLGGIDREAFARRFGLSHEALVAGGRELVAGGGDLGEILFAAGGGLAGLRQVRSDLVEEARGLFLPTGRKRINEQLTALAEVKKAIRDATLSIQQYHDDRQSLERDTAEEASLRERMVQLRERRDQRNRFRLALRQAGRRRMAISRLEELRDAPLLNEDFSQQRLELDRKLAAQRQVLAHATARREQALEQLQAMNVPEAVLAQAEEIERLREGLGAYQKAEADLPGVEKRLELVERDMQLLLARLGHDLRPEDAERLQVPSEDRERVRQLASEHAAVVQAAEQASSLVRRLERRLQQVEAERDAAAQPVELRPLRDALRAAGVVGRVTGQVAEAMEEATAARQAVETEVARLAGWDRGIEALEHLATPSAATVDAFERELAEHDRHLERASERAAELEEKLAEVGREIERLHSKRSVPTEGDLTAVRAERDLLWNRLRGGMQGGPAAGQEEAEPRPSERRAAPPATGEALQAYEEAVRRADEIADRLRHEAEDVARLADLLVDREELQERLAEATRRRDTWQAKYEKRQREWRDVWREVGVPVAGPAEMRAWLVQCERALSTAAAAREAERVADRWRREADELARRLRRALGDAVPPEADHLDDLIESGLARQEALEAANDRLGKLQQETTRLAEQLAAARHDEEEAAARLVRWEAAWQAAAQRIGLPGDAPAMAAERRMDDTSELLGRRREQLQFRQRIDGMVSDSESFAQAVCEVAKKCASDLCDSAPAEAVIELARRLAEGRRQQQRAADLAEHRDAAEREVQAAKESIGRLQAEQAVLCRTAGVERPEELPEAERRAQLRREAEAERRELDAMLAELTRGEPLEAFLEAAEQHHAAELEAEIDRLDHEIEQLAAEHEAVGKRVAVLADRLRHLSDASAAAGGRERAVELLAEIAGDSRQYVRLRLAAGVLERAIERYRQQNQGPVLQRASELLARLTCGSLAGLRADFDASGTPVLLGVRDDGRTVPVSGMSEGTADQLYLALRIASLEVHLGRRNRMPLVVDDILIKFDDPRSRAALEVLAELSDATQVIFFTHHQRVVELAREAVSADRLSVQHLDGVTAVA